MNRFKLHFYLLKVYMQVTYYRVIHGKHTALIYIDYINQGLEHNIQDKQSVNNLLRGLGLEESTNESNNQ